MSRMLTLFMVAAIAAMTVVFALVARTHWDAISHLATLDDARKRLVLAAVLGAAFCPLWAGIGGLFVARQLGQRDLQLSARHRRFYEASMVIVVLFIAAIQAWLAFGVDVPPFSDRGFMLRVTLVFCGVFTAVYGNFNAKAPPPSGALAPAPGDWVRGMLRNGWAMVALGLGQSLAALVLPARLLPFAILVMALPTLLIVRSQQRLMWPSRGPSANA